MSLPILLAGASGTKLVMAPAVSPLLSVVRSGNASLFTNTGTMATVGTNTGRLEYYPANLTLEGFLSEPAATNLLVQSAAFDNASWAKQAGITVTADQATALDGTTTADQIAKTATGFQYVNQNFSGTSGVSYCFSVFLKAGTLSLAGMRLEVGTTQLTTDINLSTGVQTVRTSSGTVALVSSQNCGNGWWRYAISILAPSTAGGICYIYAGNASDTVAGNIFAWGAQLEATTVPTSYIPTAGVSATRNADVVSVANINWLNRMTGTLIVDFDFSELPPAATFPRIVSLVGADPNVDEISIYYGAGTSKLAVGITTGGVLTANPDMAAFPTLAARTRRKCAISWNNSTAIGAAGGQATAEVAVTGLPVITGMSLFGAVRFQPAWLGHIASLTYYPFKMGAAKLAALTT